MTAVVDQALAVLSMVGFDSLPPRLREKLRTVPLNIKDVVEIYHQYGEAATLAKIDRLLRTQRPSFHAGEAERPEPHLARRKRDRYLPPANMKLATGRRRA